MKYRSVFSEQYFDTFIKNLLKMLWTLWIAKLQLCGTQQEQVLSFLAGWSGLGSSCWQLKCLWANRSRRLQSANNIPGGYVETSHWRFTADCLRDESLSTFSKGPSGCICVSPCWDGLSSQTLVDAPLPGWTNKAAALKHSRTDEEGSHSPPFQLHHPQHLVTGPKSRAERDFSL